MSAPGDPLAGTSVLSLDATRDMLVRYSPVVMGLLNRDERLVDLDGALLSRQDGWQLWLGQKMTDLIRDEAVIDLVRQGLVGFEGTGFTEINARPWMVAVQPVWRDGAVVGVTVMLTYANIPAVHRDLSASEATNERFAALVEMSTDFIAMADLDGEVTYLNRAGRLLVGLEEDTHLGRSVDYFTQAALSRVDEFTTSLRSRGSWQGVSSLRHFQTGEGIPVAVDAYLVRRPQTGELLGVATVQRDLRLQLQAEATMEVRVLEQRIVATLAQLALTLSPEELMQEAIRLLSERYPELVTGVLRLQPTARLVMIACSEPSMVGEAIPVSPASLTGRALIEDSVVRSPNLSVDDRFQGETPAEEFGMHSMLCAPVAGRSGHWGVVGASGRSTNAWTDDDETFISSIAATLSAALRRHELETQLQVQALHDPLTGLPNRALITDRIEQALQRSGGHEGAVAVLLLDLDDFKTINDSLGHSSGDQLLVKLADRLQSVVSSTDTVGRLGGDEFVVVCENNGGKNGIETTAGSLLDACSQGFVVDDRDIVVSCSIGISVVADVTTSPSRILGEADVAMCRAKHDRPGSYQIFHKAMRGDALGRLNLAGQLRQSIRANQLSVAYQPIVDLVSGDIVAMEALARWTNAADENIEPAVFVPLAEETGLIGALGESVLRQAVLEATKWQSDQSISLRVNASAHELRNRDYADRVFGILDRVGLSRRLLGIEITESSLVDDDQTSRANLTKLTDGGVTLLIDDFGTGFSSLSYLQRFPNIDILKIDRSFLAIGQQGKAVIEAVIALGAAFNMQVCAEGVESLEQRHLLTELGCDLAQGYLFQRPIRPSGISALLTDWNPGATLDG